MTDTDSPVSRIKYHETELAQLHAMYPWAGRRFAECPQCGIMCRTQRANDGGHTADENARVCHGCERANWTLHGQSRKRWGE